MDISLIMYLVIFLVVIVLIFKLIKKIIFAIFAVIFIVIAVFGGVGAMIYFDYQDLTSQQNFNLNVVYGSLDEAKFGISVPFENQELVQDKVSSLNIDPLNEELVENSEDAFYVFIEEDLFNSLLVDNQEYYLIGTENLEVSGFELDAGLSKIQVLDLINSDDSENEYVEILLNQNNLGDFADLGASTLAKKELESKLNGIDFRAALVLSILSDLDTQGMKTLVVGFKEEELLVYPEKFSFKFLRMLPIDTLVGAISSEDSSLE